jgi:hypothetical protein
MFLSAHEGLVIVLVFLAITGGPLAAAWIAAIVRRWRARLGGPRP